MKREELEDKMSGNTKTYYIIYEITNKINGKKYRGAHKTKNPNDSYFGSGILIKQAIKKYGKENFTIEHLAYALTYEGLFWLEEHVFVNDEWVKNKNTYNLRKGGAGLFNGEAREQTCLEKYGVEYYSQSTECKERIKTTCLEKYGVERYVQSEEFKNNMKNKYNETNPHPLTGRPISEDTKQKIRNANLGKKASPDTKKKLSTKFKGENNPNYGVKHGEEVKIKCSEANQKYAYTIISPEGDIYKTHSLLKFCIEHSLDRNAFRNVIRTGNKIVEFPKNITQCSKLRLNTTGWMIKEILLLSDSPKAKYPSEVKI